MLLDHASEPGRLELTVKIKLPKLQALELLLVRTVPKRIIRVVLAAWLSGAASAERGTKRGARSRCHLYFIYLDKYYWGFGYFE